MNNRFYIKPTFLLIIILITGACSNFQDNGNYSDITETEKDLSGKWKIATATRNGQDITKMMDFTKFRLNLNSDGSYTIENHLPFLVQNDGEWETDDPQFPFSLIFRESGTSTSVVTELYYPAVDGKRRISLTFSPGCHSNIYTYVFVIDTNNL